ncbi:uncharacterized protein BXZ73DRAFT_50171 [Epithele typhae]|uniref:uncharacterized protein n=1 Tax=Epithele typhae TaxID=378194 RepID=UPI0020077559|nr:uncharacterized protein BXZ73DRAFT_50171 [Epithele typhae]KAH9925011.1 hypothetical protein BXZ73DRAFT_50171 [Epithele typhae]
MDPSTLPSYAQGSSRSTNTPASTSANLRPHHSNTTARRPETTHSYHLTDSKNRPWLTLSVLSNVSTPHHLPSFTEGDTIRGSVVLDREKEDGIKSISVKVVGQMTSSVTEVLNFVTVSETLWTAPDPRSSQPGSDRDPVGVHTWPFSIRLPPRCEIKSATGALEAFALPASFSERMARVHIQYQLIATVHRRRFRVDSTLGTVVGYRPRIRPGEPSIARQIAYLENTPIPGPDEDPDGWKWLASLPVRGSVFSTRTVDATCTLALALPLCYTRGSVIPCVLALEATDPQALDLLSAPRAPVVRLLRTVATGERALETRRGLEFEHERQALATAVWRPAADAVGVGAGGGQHPHRRPGRRVLHGEIHLASNLKPTSRLGRFELSVSLRAPPPVQRIHLHTHAHAHAHTHPRPQYTVAVYPFSAAAFQPDGDAGAVLQQEPVVVGTVHAPGPRPRAYSPPSYDDVGSAVGQSTEFRLFR